jgi:hypothetical protein
MATTRRTMRGVTPAQVFDVLRDGHTYAHWVVGTRAIRAVDPGWPEPGRRLHYTVGYRPLRKDDVTTSTAYEPDARLELEGARLAGGHGRRRAAGGADRGRHAGVDRRGAAARPGPADAQPAADLLIKVRNVETLRRLEELASRR